MGTGDDLSASGGTGAGPSLGGQCGGRMRGRSGAPAALVASLPYGFGGQREDVVGGALEILHPDVVRPPVELDAGRLLGLRHAQPPRVDEGLGGAPARAGVGGFTAFADVEAGAV